MDNEFEYFWFEVTNFYGQKYINLRLAQTVPKVIISGLSRIPYLGPIFFRQNYIVYASYILVVVSWFILFKIKTGVQLRAIG